MKWKYTRFQKIVLIILSVIIVLAGSYMLIPGFSKQGNVYIGEYSVSEDGKEMTIQVGVTSSIGYIRKVSVHQQHGGKLYLDCYSAFGGINGSIGAKNEYTIQIEADTNTIAVYRSPNAYEIIFEKDTNGNWNKVR